MKVVSIKDQGQGIFDSKLNFGRINCKTIRAKWFLKEIFLRTHYVI